MTKDYYREARAIARMMHSEGHFDWANRLEASIEEGATVTEILMMLRWNLSEFWALGLGSSELNGLTHDLDCAIDAALQ
ncbi:hypothetical protein AB4Y64_11095 [Lysobacter sp. TAF61]|uniref:hypothetical protein n=1 Tax=Lysobacter sp. TAF61 TaxID=3233072 RepID=UPI003F969992